jgi:hypothetical protein
MRLAPARAPRRNASGKESFRVSRRRASYYAPRQPAKAGTLDTALEFAWHIDVQNGYSVDQSCN